MTVDQRYFQARIAEHAVDGLRTALWVFDFDEKRILWANQAALVAWQAKTLNDLRSRDLGADMPCFVEQRLQQYKNDFIEREAAFTEFWTLYPNDIPTNMHVILSGFRLPDNRVGMLCEGVETDSTASQTLRSANALLQSPAMISLFRTDGEQLFRNPAARLSYGNADKALGDQFAEKIDWKALKDELCTGGTVKRIARMNTSGGTPWHEITARRSKDAVTGDDLILVSEVDISDLKVAEQRLHDFASVSSDWFWEMDSDLRFSYFSDRASEFPIADIGIMLGKRRSDFMEKPDQRWQAHLDDLENRHPFRDFRYAIRDEDGRAFHMSTSGVPFFDQHGSFAGYRGTGTNITDQVEAEQQRAQQRELETALAKEREINGLQRQFISMVSHEFRTPLAIIDGSAQRLMRKPDKMTPERTNEVLQKVRLSVARLTELMESVLDAARLEEGRVIFAPKTCNLTDIVQEICDSYAEVYPDHPIRLNIEPLADPVIADPKLVRQIISNLTSNAVKYSPAGTSIFVSAVDDEAKGDVVISVRDEGVGIPKSELGQLYERFFRASTSTGIAGTGIGLHLVQHFVALHDGRIDVDSVEGKGSTFTVRLPKRAA